MVSANNLHHNQQLEPNLPEEAKDGNSTEAPAPLVPLYNPFEDGDYGHEFYTNLPRDEQRRLLALSLNMVCLTNGFKILHTDRDFEILECPLCYKLTHLNKPMKVMNCCQKLVCCPCFHEAFSNKRYCSWCKKPWHDGEQILDQALEYNRPERRSFEERTADTEFVYQRKLLTQFKMFRSMLSLKRK